MARASPSSARSATPSHWVSPLLAARNGPIGRELVARRRVPAGTLVHMAGGHVMTVAQCRRLPRPLRCFPTHISDNLLIGRCSVDEPEEPGAFVNRSWDPHCATRDRLAILPRRRLAAGEPVTIDCAMCMTSSILNLN